MASSAENLALGIVKKLQAAGHTTYFAGGCVRDRLMGRVPKDFDVATSALPEQVLGLFPRSQKVGVAFGVVLVKERFGGKAGDFVQVEVATFRADGTYSDGRHPDAVRFTTAEEDARRRDFTCNGLFFDPLASGGTGQLHDFVGGRADIEAKVLRAIGDPEARFSEDHLRMLRAVRFAAKLGFEIEEGTREAIRNHASKIRTISRERVGEEFRMILEHPARGGAVSMMERLGLMQEIWPTQFAGRSSERITPVEGANNGNASDHESTRAAPRVHSQGQSAAGSEETAEGSGTGALLSGVGSSSSEGEGGGQRVRRVDILPPEAPRALALAALCLDYGGGEELVDGLRDALALSNQERDDVAWFLGNLPSLADRGRWTRPITKKLLADSRWNRLDALYLAEHGGIRDSALDQWVALMTDEGVAPAPFITGATLIQLGAAPGPNFRAWLDSLYDRQLENEFQNAGQAVAAARELIDQSSSRH